MSVLAPPQPLAGKRFRLSISGKQALFGYAILLPTLAIILIFRFLPMLQAFYISLHEYDLIRPPRFIGLENFIDLLQDPLFLHSARISVAYVVFSCVPVWILSLALAVLFNREIRAKNLFRSAAFMPVVMPAVVNAVVWTFMYHQDGVVNTILGWFGIDPIPWLRSSRWALWAIIIIGIWRATPYYMVIFLAGLQAIPNEYYEAAQIDGASPWGQFWHITLAAAQAHDAAGDGDERDRGHEGLRRAAHHDRRRAGRCDARAAAVHLSDGIRVLQDGAGGGHERVPLRRRDDLHALPDPAVRARGELRMGQRSRRQWGFKYPLLIGVALIGLLPYYWMVACSFKTNDTMFAVPLQWLPDPINWSAYGTAWRAQDFTRYFLNTGVVALAITAEICCWARWPGTASASSAISAAGRSSSSSSAP